MSNSTKKTETRTIAGREITLETGHNYIACRPIRGMRNTREFTYADIRGLDEQSWAIFERFEMTWEVAYAESQFEGEVRS